MEKENIWNELKEIAGNVSDINLSKPNVILQTKGDDEVVGTIRYWEGIDNPFCRNGEYPENIRVIEINEAEGSIDKLDEDNIRLVGVDKDGNFNAIEVRDILNENIGW